MTKAKKAKRDYAAIANITHDLESIENMLENLYGKDFNASIFVGDDTDGDSVLAEKSVIEDVLHELKVGLESELAMELIK